MRARGIASVAALAAALLLVVLSGCGGSDGSTGDSTAAGESSVAGAGAEKKARGDDSGDGATNEKAGDRNDGSAGSGGKVQTAPLKVSGGGSAQYQVPGGDNSVQEFGEEGDETELEEAATALHDYLVARAEEDWPAACAELSRSVMKQLQALASRAESLEGRGCAAILQTLTPSLPPSVRRESTVVDAGSLRLEGERAFLIYRGADGTTYAIAMAPEDDGWKVGSLAATPLS